jgi:outer membrane protein assembly factor BamA
VFSEWDAIEARLQAAYTQPWFLGLRTPATALVYWEPPLKDPTLGYTVEKLGVEFFWNVSPSREVSVVPWIAIDQVNLSDLPRESDPEAFRREQGLTNRVRVGVRCRYDSSDDLFIPTRGYVLAGHLMQTGGFLGGDVDYFEAVASAVRYTPWRGWVIAKRVRLGAQWPVESGYVPRDDRFFLGGAFDVRSYRENRLGPIDAGDNPEGGQAEVLANIEFRHRLFWRFGYSLFADAGQLWPSVDDVGYDRPEAAFGVGLQFVSPAGPLRLDFARRAAPRGHRFHLSILYAF